MRIAVALLLALTGLAFSQTFPTRLANEMDGTTLDCPDLGDIQPILCLVTGGDAEFSAMRVDMHADLMDDVSTIKPWEFVGGIIRMRAFYTNDGSYAVGVMEGATDYTSLVVIWDESAR